MLRCLNYFIGKKFCQDCFKGWHKKTTPEQLTFFGITFLVTFFLSIFLFFVIGVMLQLDRIWLVECVRQLLIIVFSIIFVVAMAITLWRLVEDEEDEL